MIHFLDIGANVGQTFDGYLHHHAELDGCTVWCFEPSTRHITALKEKVKQYSAKYKIVICPFGLLDKNCVLPFYEKDDPQGDSFKAMIRGNHPQANLSHNFKLLGAAVCLGDFILQNTTDKDEVIVKMDCEGSEYALLPHLLERNDVLPRIRQILVEWHWGEDVDSSVIDNLNKKFAERGRPLEQWMF